MKNNAINLKLKAYDIYSKTYAKFGKANDKLRKDRKKDDKAVLKSRDIQRKFQNTLKDISSYKKLSDSLKQNSFDLRAAKEKVNNLSTAFKAAKRPTDAMSASLEKAKSKAANLKTKFDENTYAAGRLKKSLRDAGIQTKNLGTEKEKLKSKISSLTPKINSETAAHRKQMGVLRKMNELRDRRDKRLQRGANMAITGYGTLGTGRVLGRGLIASLQGGLGFEQIMSKVAAKTNLTKDSLKYKMLESSAQKLGANSDFTAREVAGGQAYLAQANFKPHEIIKSMPGIMSLSKADGMGLESTADIASDILTAFKLEASEMTMVADVLAKTFTTSNTNLSQLGETFKYVGANAAALKIPISDIAAMTAMLGDAGRKGSIAGTGERQMLQRLAAPEGKGKAALEKLGVKTVDDAGNFRDIITIIEEIEEATKGLGTGTKTGVIKDIVGMIASTDMKILLEGSKNGVLRNKAKEYKNPIGFSAKIASGMADNALGDWTLYKSMVEGLSISFTKTLNPMIRETVQWITKMGSGLNDLMQKYPNVTKVAGTFVGVLAGLMVVGGGAMIAMGGIAGAMALTSWSSGVIAASKFGGAIRLVGTAIKFVGRALFMNPIGLAVLAIAGAGYLVYKYWEPIKEFFSNFWEGTKEKWASFTGWTSNMWASTKEKWSIFTNWVGNMWDSVANLWATAKQKLSSFTLKDVGTAVVAGLTTAFIWSPLELISSGFLAVKNWLSNFSLKDVGAAIVNSLKAPFTAMFDWFDNKFSSFTSGLGAGSKAATEKILKDVGPNGHKGGILPGIPQMNRDQFGQQIPIKRAFGGWTSGAGTSRSDSIPAMLSDGEHTTQAPMARHNVGLLNGINSGKITEIGINAN